MPSSNLSDSVIPSPTPDHLALQSEPTVSHHKARQFKPEKLKAPRDFEVPTFVTQRLNACHNLNEKEHQALLARPLVVEIGAGKGMHACLYAKQHGDHDLIAIERTQNKFSAFKTLASSVSKEVALLDNLLPVHADAIPYCVSALPAQSVSVIYLLYPNPEPKNPNQQWLNMPFFEFLLSRLVPQGQIILASNIPEYIDNAYQQSLQTWQLPTERTLVPVDSRRTHFEIKYLARGETCWELQMTKPKAYVTRFDNWNSEWLKW